MLMQVWKRVSQSVPDALLLVVGSGGIGIQNCEAQLRSYVHQNGLDNSIRFTGSVENIRDYLHAADLFVFPSRKESFGISVAEAMACGLPVAASDIPGLSDVVVPGVTAHVFPPNNADAIYQSVYSLLNDEALRETMGSAGRQRAETHFAESAIIDSYVTLIRESA
jgi:glycosyltransferase involved in cell wall biosynthesis